MNKVFKAHSKEQVANAIGVGPMDKLLERAALTERERRVLDLRHGLVGNEASDAHRHSFLEISTELGVSTVRARQVYHQALYNVRTLAYLVERGITLTEQSSYDLDRYRSILWQHS